MEAPVLDGLLEGYPTVIDTVAQRLPDLLVLILFLRGGSNQRISTHCIWPDPIWVYAPPFAQFTKLRHFEWNYPYHEGVVTPWSLLLLEGQDIQDHNESVLPYLAHESDDDEDIDHVPYAASVFRVYCQAPELTVVYTRPDQPSKRWWMISDSGKCVPDTRECDPDSLDLEWNPWLHRSYLDVSCRWW
ncbi:uncharacterized protein EV420DRAFT_1636694 [Desarmillaria tabescens]|uniref:Uncharacterized protein n=1 Tax=Armillaria tabescens TaxID=1929756 RepID=A0AA39NID0_ARMTA|nr:uncharacterized protein EV420DRAFT_1636694 [Desarmillaria tabescens]KAK0466084.1 hypothetical protein EV420DRAFT_1636694 [Desarmillaria tabescens]